MHTGMFYCTHRSSITYRNVLLHTGMFYPTHKRSITHRNALLHTQMLCSTHKFSIPHTNSLSHTQSHPSHSLCSHKHTCAPSCAIALCKFGIPGAADAPNVTWAELFCPQGSFLQQTRPWGVLPSNLPAGDFPEPAGHNSVPWGEVGPGVLSSLTLPGILSWDIRICSAYKQNFLGHYHRKLKRCFTWICVIAGKPEGKKKIIKI